MPTHLAASFTVLMGQQLQRPPCPHLHPPAHPLHSGGVSAPHSLCCKEGAMASTHWKCGQGHREWQRQLGLAGWLDRWHPCEDQACPPRPVLPSSAFTCFWLNQFPYWQLDSGFTPVPLQLPRNVLRAEHTVDVQCLLNEHIWHHSARIVFTLPQRRFCCCFVLPLSARSGP